MAIGSSSTTGRLIALGVLALAAASCAPTGQVAPPPSSVRVPAAPMAGIALGAARYMELVASSALFAVRASELAQERSQDGRIRALAGTIASEQGGVGSQLSYAGRRLDLLPSATLTAEDQAKLDALAASQDFDSSWLRSQESTMARCSALHRDFARSGSSPTLRPVAEMAAPVCQRHLAQIRTLEKSR